MWSMQWLVIHTDSEFYCQIFCLSPGNIIVNTQFSSYWYQKVTGNCLCMQPEQRALGLTLYSLRVPFGTQRHNFVNI